MVNKKGFLRIVEATLSIMIVLSVLLLIAGQNKPIYQKNIGELIPPVLQKMSEDKLLRGEILNYDLNLGRETASNADILKNINIFIKKELKNPALNSSVSICKLDFPCPVEPFPIASNGEIYSQERVVGTDYWKVGFQPRKVKIFVWRI